MTPQECKKFEEIPRVIKGSDLQDQQDRTLLMDIVSAYHCFTMKLKDGRLVINNGGLIKQEPDEGFQLDDLIPPGCTFRPRECDFETCQLLREKGIPIRFARNNP